MMCSVTLIRTCRFDCPAPWFGTSHQGAWRYDGTSLQQFTEADGLDVGHVATFFTNRRGDVWVGGKGVYKFNGESFDRIH